MEHSKDPKKYELLMGRIKTKRNMIGDLKNIIKTLNEDIKEDINQIYELCNHKYDRECTTSGCYPEYDYICQYCRKCK